MTNAAAIMSREALARFRAPWSFPSSPIEKALRERVEQLLARLKADRFQLAVVGQFKRGKSSLLNALLGAPVLPTGVVPLTAIPTFIRSADQPLLTARYIDGREESWREDLPELQVRLASLVTETRNPHNRKGVARVEIALPSPLLADGLVLIDTPGIGSAERHNSETARAALPECDAALLVLSPDPPITEAEIAYLAEVRAAAEIIVPVLNKIDLVEGEERGDAFNYLRKALERIGIDAPISVTASRPGVETGIADLSSRIGALGGGERRQLLERAIARKVRAAAQELAFHNDAALAALRMPLDDLARKMAELRDAAADMRQEHAIASDLGAGERQRLLKAIDDEAGRLKQRATDTLATEAEAAPDFNQVADRTRSFFEGEYRRLSQWAVEQLEAAAERQRSRLLPLLDLIRARAADLLGIAFRPPDIDLDVGIEIDLAWRDRPAETMNPLPAGAIDRLLPASLRRQRARARLEREIDRLVTLNNEHLRWTLNRRIDEALRRFDAQLDRELEEASTSVVAMLDGTLDLRRNAVASVAEDLVAREDHAALLTEILSA
ncbi:MAG: dynamin family protein [Sphingomonas bacterium]